MSRSTTTPRAGNAPLKTMIPAGWTLAGLMAAALLPASLQPQDLPTYAITGAEIHTLAGEVIPNGTVVISGGLITAVGAGAEVPDGAERIDAAGKRVYPGLFDAGTNLGLTEVGAVPVTNDFREIGDYNPHLVAASAVHPSSEHIPVARANGITHAVSSPSAGGSGIPGQGTLINLAGWTIEEMTVVTAVVMILQWPTLSTTSFDFNTFSRVNRPYREALADFESEVEAIREWFESARHYMQASQAGGRRVERDLRLEALASAMRREVPMILIANGERNIRNAVEFAEEEGLDYIIAGGQEAWKVTDLLSEHDVSVILGPTQTMPADEDEAYDETYSNPGRLHAAGIQFAIATFGSSNVRTLPWEAAQAVPFGLPREAALEAITINPARMLGVDDRLGTVEEGKMANLIVTDGDPLEIQTQVEHLFIGGVRTPLDNKHLRLYETYRSRPPGR